MHFSVFENTKNHNMQHSVPAVLSILVFLHLSGISLSLQNQTLDENIPALYVIGDSLSDPGNNNRIRTLFKANFPPYGRDFDGQRSTGRFSNGKLLTDYIASALGIKDLLPAYLDPRVRTKDLCTGVSFASAGAGFDDMTCNIMSVIPISKQLEFLKECLERVKEKVGEEKGNKIVSNSLYAMILGSNDFLTTYYSTPFRRVHYDLPAYISFIVEAASNVIKALYELGARRVFITELPPLGCVPLRRTMKGGPLRECDESLNEACVSYNTQLSMQIKSLATDLEGSKIIYVDIYTVLLEIINHPKHYGFDDERFGCCGTGTVESALLCNKHNPFTCSDASKFVFWDSVHPSQRLNQIVVSQLLPIYRPFFSVICVAHLRRCTSSLEE